MKSWFLPNSLRKLVNQALPLLIEACSLLFQPSSRTANPHIEVTARFGYSPGIAGQAILKKPEMAAWIADRIEEFLFFGDD